MERHLCDSQDSSNSSQTVSRNAAQNASQTVLPETNAETGRGFPLPTNIYAVQASNVLGDGTRPQMNMSSAASMQKSPLPTVASPNSCYLLYLNVADNSQVMMPMAMGVSGIGLKVPNQQPPQISDAARDHQSSDDGGLRAPISASPSGVSSACAQSDGVPACPSQDKSKPPVAVVVPWTSVACSYSNSASLPADERIGGQEQRNSLTASTPSSVMIYQTINNQTSAVQPQITSGLPSPAQHSALQRHLGQQLSVQQSYVHLPGTQMRLAQPVGNRQLLVQQQGSQQLLVQQQGNQQLLVQQQSNQQLLVRPQGSCLQPENRLQPTPQQQGAFLQATDIGHLQQSTASHGGQQPTGGQVNNSQLQQANRQHIASQDGLQQQSSSAPFIPQNGHQQLTAQQLTAQQLTAQQNSLHNQFQSASHQQLLALRLGSAQSLMSHQVASNQQLALQQVLQQRPMSNGPLLATQRLTHSVRQRLNVIPTLTSAEALSRTLVQQGIQKQLAAAQNNQQQMAFLLRNCTHAASNARAMISGGSQESAKLQLDNGHQMLAFQQGCFYQLTDLQQRILQRSSCQLSSDAQRTSQMLNRPVKLDNSCMQLELQQQQQMQHQMQQQQLLQQQMHHQQQQQQQQSSCQYRTQDGVGANQSVKEEIHNEMTQFHHESHDYKLPVSDAESSNVLQSQTIASRSAEMSQACTEEPNSSTPNFTDQSRNFRLSGLRLRFPSSTPDAEQIIRNAAIQSNRFPSQSVEQLSHLFAHQFVQQNATNFAASSNFGLNVPGQGTVANEQNRIQPVPVQSFRTPVASGPRHKTLDGRNLNVNSNIESPNYVVSQPGPKSVDVRQPNPGDNVQVKNTGDGNIKAGLNNVTGFGNGTFSNNFQSPSPLQQRLPHQTSSNFVASTPLVDNSSQQRPMCYSSPIAMPRFQHSRLPGYIQPVQQSAISSSANCPKSHNSPVTTAATQCVSIPSPQVPVQPEANQTSSEVAVSSDEKGQELLAGLPSPKQMGVARVFISVAQPTSGVNSLSPTDISAAETPGKQLEVGQECELRYHNGPRIATIWDGKYFKLKRPLYSNQEADQSDVSAVQMASIKGGGAVVPKEEHESTVAGPASESRATINDSATSLAHQETGGCNSLTVSLARPPLRPPAADEQGKSPGGVSPAKPGSNSVPAAAKRQREEGKFAVCKHCGAFSCDFNRCDQCHRDLPPDVKIYDPAKKQKLEAVSRSPSASLASVSAKTQPQRAGIQAHGPKRPVLEADAIPKTPNAVKVTHSSKKPSTRQHRRQETEVVHILSSDDEEEEDEDPLGSASKKNVKTPISSAKNKTRKSKSESVANVSLAKTPELKPATSNCPLASSSQAVACGVLSRFNKFPESPAVTADALHVFFGYIRYEKKCFLTLNQTTMAVQSVDVTDGGPLSIRASEIQMVAGHFNLRQCLTCLFVLVTPDKAFQLRKLLNRGGDNSFDPNGGDDCAKYVVLFLTEQRPSFLDDVAQMIAHMRNACGSDKPYYKQIDAFDVEKYLQTVCPTEEIQSFTWKSVSRQSSVAIGGTPSNDTGELQRSQENDPDDEDMDYGSRSPSPVHVLFSGQIIKLFTYPPAPATGGISVTNEDLFCLNEAEFLNDVIIDFYLKYLMTEFLSDKFNRTHVFSSFFYRRLTQKPSRRHKEEEEVECTSIQQRRHSRIRTWTRHVDLFEKDFIIVPINESAHWYLAIICYPGLIAPEMGYRPISDGVANPTPDVGARSDGKKVGEGRGRSRSKQGKVEKMGTNDDTPQVQSTGGGRRGRGRGRKAAATPVKQKTEQYVKKMPCILIFDSLAGPGRNGVIRILREYLQVEWDVKKKDLLGQRLFTKDNMKGATPECPQQSNFSDCGIYVLQYVESFFTDPIEDFTFPLKLLGKWFDEEKVKNKRAGLQQLILDMQKRYNLSLDFNPERDGCLIKQDTDETTETAAGCQTTA